jgi:glycosyltransferase involved in cell wall biosynthesis
MPIYPRVNVLLSTFNGICFLSQQLDSLQAQDYPNIFIYIRDNGSTDGTADFLQNYQKQFPNVKLRTGQNIGYKRSFLEL